MRTVDQTQPNLETETHMEIIGELCQSLVNCPQQSSGCDESGGEQRKIDQAAAYTVQPVPFDKVDYML